MSRQAICSTLCTWTMITVTLASIAGHGSSPSEAAMHQKMAPLLMPASPEALHGPCPVTKPSANTPPGPPTIPSGYANDALWTNLWMWGEGEVVVPASRVQPDGSLGPLKWAWWRFRPGHLTIDGHRLDGAAPPLRAENTEGVDIGFLPVLLIFPSPGCWEVTGRLGDSSLTFVTVVVAPDIWATPPASP